MSIFGFFGPPSIEKLKSRRDIEGLIRVLNSPNPLELRKSAIIALGEIGDGSAIEVLLQIFVERNHDVGDVIEASIGSIASRLGSSVVKTLLRSPAMLHVEARALIGGIISQLGDLGYKALIEYQTSVDTPSGIPIIDSKNQIAFQINEKAIPIMLKEIGTTEAVDTLVALTRVGKFAEAAYLVLKEMGIQIRDSRVAGFLISRITKYIDKGNKESLSIAQEDFRQLSNILKIDKENIPDKDLIQIGLLELRIEALQLKLTADFWDQL